MNVLNQLENGDTKSFWTAVSDGRLVFQRCVPCGHVQHPPRHQCSTCWSDQLDQVESTGRGAIESLTVVRRAPTPAFRAKVPYVVVAVIMDEGPRMIANLLGNAARDARPADRVEIIFAADDEGTTLPQFKLAACDAK